MFVRPLRQYEQFFVTAVRRFIGRHIVHHDAVRPAIRDISGRVLCPDVQKAPRIRGYRDVIRTLNTVLLHAFPLTDLLCFSDHQGSFAADAILRIRAARHCIPVKFPVGDRIRTAYLKCAPRQLHRQVCRRMAVDLVIIDLLF